MAEAVSRQRQANETPTQATLTDGRPRRRVRPSVLLERYRTEIRSIVARHRGANPRVFGSVLHGTDTEESDLDLLVDSEPG
ncbi:nucleotidyltransferase family protein [Vineibacter terrae]|uniref:nucleotidyltransferase family protein n=1 Tax=Vineibacter terrae TaxID=2586908 RepID=UPI002E328E8A|nr:nucleotidyltransferase domain-containing protein [Vineibacter terrae]HEX2890769.1 nucleotidyltransferase domain-containing protein [Vineibacter terrae]